MTLAQALLFPPGFFSPATPAPPSIGDRLLHEDGAFFLLEDGLGYLLLE